MTGVFEHTNTFKSVKFFSTLTSVAPLGCAPELATDLLLLGGLAFFARPSGTLSLWSRRGGLPLF